MSFREAWRGRDLFDDSKGVIEEGAFAKKVRILREAIDASKAVKFNYRKYEGEKSVRTIYPESFKKLGMSLCVEGHCVLRKANRVFNIQRISNIKLAD